MNARDISQKSFSPIQSEIFASQKQSHLEFKGRQHNYNNYIKSPPFLFFQMKKPQAARINSGRKKEDGGEEIQKLKEHDLCWKSNLYF